MRYVPAPGAAGTGYGGGEMKPIQVVVVESDGRARAQLVSVLHDLGVAQVGEAPDAGMAPALCAATSADLLLCGLSAGLAPCLELLTWIARLRPAPAVAFHGAGSGIDQVEHLCLGLGLRYLGLLAPPIVPTRLRRMIAQLEAFHARGGPP